MNRRKMDTYCFSTSVATFEKDACIVFTLLDCLELLRKRPLTHLTNSSNTSEMKLHTLLDCCCFCSQFKPVILALSGVFFSSSLSLQQIWNLQNIWHIPDIGNHPDILEIQNLRHFLQNPNFRNTWTLQNMSDCQKSSRFFTSGLLFQLQPIEPALNEYFMEMFLCSEKRRMKRPQENMFTQVANVVRKPPFYGQ